MKNITKSLKKHEVEICIQGAFINHLIIRLSKMPITLHHIKYDQNKLKFITNIDNVKILKKECRGYKIKITSETGLYKIKTLIRKNHIFLICLLVALILFWLLKNTIVSVEVIHSDKKVRQLVSEELENYNIKRLTFKKDYQTLQKIKNKILAKYPDKLEWLEIENVGMTYKVKVEERILTKIKEDDGYCHIVATKNSIITKITNSLGEQIKTSRDYVSKGDIIVSGDILVGEEVKESLCAKGEAYGEVWYTVKVNIPLTYEEKQKTGKMRYNLKYKYSKEEKSILKPRFKNYVSQDNKLFSLFNTSFYLEKQYEVTKKAKTYTQKEALEQAINKAKEKIQLQLNDKERILTQKVLKISENNSTMNVEIFVAVEEKISKIEHYTAEQNNNPEMKGVT